MKLTLVLLFSIFLFFYKLDQIPSGLHVDEASHGYNAYSILQTGKDEYGKSYPFSFKFFGTYTPPLYTYLTTLPVGLFGLSILSTRFISALCGVLATLFIYLLIKQLNFKNKWLPFLGALIFTLSPWEIIFARSGYEANLGLLLFIISTYFLLKGINNNLFANLGLIILSISTLACFANRFLAPLLLLGFLALFKEYRKTKLLLPGFLIALLIQIPNLYLLTTPAFFSKAYLLSFNNDFFSQAINYLSPRSLFLIGDSNPQRSIPTLGVFYSWMVIPFLWGFYKLFKLRKERYLKLIIMLIVISILPAALVNIPFSSYRAIALLFPLILVITLGINEMVSKKFGKVVLFLFLIVSVVQLWRGYFVFLPNERAKAWNYGYEQLAEQIKLYSGEKFLIDLSREGPIYINLLFFSKYDPQLLHQNIMPEEIKNYYYRTSFSPEIDFANVSVRSINFKEDVYNDQIIVADSISFRDQGVSEHKLTKVFGVKDPLGNLLFHGFRTNPKEKCQGYLEVDYHSDQEKKAQCEKFRNE